VSDLQLYNYLAEQSDKFGRVWPEGVPASEDTEETQATLAQNNRER